MKTNIKTLYILWVQFFSPFSPRGDWREGVVTLLYAFRGGCLCNCLELHIMHYFLFG